MERIVIGGEDLFSFRPRVVFRLHASALDVAFDFTLFALRDIWIFNRPLQPRLLFSSANPASRPTLSPSCGELFSIPRETGYLCESMCQRDFTILCLCFFAITYDINGHTTLSITMPCIAHICSNNIFEIDWAHESVKFNLLDAQTNKWMKIQIMQSFEE